MRQHNIDPDQRIPRRPIEKIEENVTIESFSHSTSQEPINHKARTCNGVFTKCLSTLSEHPDAFKFSHPTYKNDTYMLPWETAILVDGQYRCPGILLNKQWVLTMSRCTDGLE